MMDVQGRLGNGELPGGRIGPEPAHVAPPDQEIAQARAKCCIETRRPHTLRDCLRAHEPKLTCRAKAIQRPRKPLPCGFVRWQPETDPRRVIRKSPHQ